MFQGLVHHSVLIVRLTLLLIDQITETLTQTRLQIRSHTHRSDQITHAHTHERKGPVRTVMFVVVCMYYLRYTLQIRCHQDVCVRVCVCVYVCVRHSPLQAYVSWLQPSECQHQSDPGELPDGCEQPIHTHTHTHTHTVAHTQSHAACLWGYG